MLRRPGSVHVLLCAAFAVFAFGCGEGAADRTEQAEAVPPPGDTFVGVYQVRGLTEDPRRGDTRELTGQVVITEKQPGRFLVHAELTTEYPVEGGLIDADVIGNAEGSREGNVISGDAETQLVLGSVPGVEADFAFIPRNVGPRIASTWTGHFRRDGMLVVTLENRPAPGEEDYSATRTTLFGKRPEGGAGN